MKLQLQSAKFNLNTHASVHITRLTMVISYNKKKLKIRILYDAKFKRLIEIFSLSSWMLLSKLTRPKSVLVYMRKLQSHQRCE